MTEWDYRMLPDDLFEEVFRMEHPEYYPVEPTRAAPVQASAAIPDPNRARVKSLWAAAMAKAKAKPIPRPIRPKRL